MTAIPLHLIAGFLGAGKTTLIRAQLAARTSEKVAVIVNDFGEALFDEVELSDGEPFRITNIPGACVCCTAPEGFVDALGAIIETGPDRILIEPTGLARPQDIIDTVRRSPHAERVVLQPVVVLLDPAQLDADHPGELMGEQIQAADVLLASRSDLATPEVLARFDKFAAELWPPPLRTQHIERGVLPEEAMAWPDAQGERLPRAAAQAEACHSHDHSTDDYRARTWRWSPDDVFSKDRLTDAIARIATGSGGAPLVRLKGIFRTQEGVFRLEVAAGQVDEGPSSFRRDSRVDVIFQTGDEAALDSAGSLLEGALLSEAELALSAERIELLLNDGRAHLVDRDRLLAVPEQLSDVSQLFPGRRGQAAAIGSLWNQLELPRQGHAILVAGDGFVSEAVPIDILCQGVLLHSLEGEPLPPEQGGPFRLLIPESANPPSGACANVKGVAKIVHRSA